MNQTSTSTIPRQDDKQNNTALERRNHKKKKKTRKINLCENQLFKLARRWKKISWRRGTSGQKVTQTTHSSMNEELRKKIEILSNYYVRYLL